jgi:hypothetical protein
VDGVRHPPPHDGSCLCNRPWQDYNLTFQGSILPTSTVGVDDGLVAGRGTLLRQQTQVGRRRGGQSGRVRCRWRLHGAAGDLHFAGHLSVFVVVGWTGGWRAAFAF